MLMETFCIRSRSQKTNIDPLKGSHMLGPEGVRHPRKLRLEARNRQGAACSCKERNAGERCKNDAFTGWGIQRCSVPLYEAAGTRVT